MIGLPEAFKKKMMGLLETEYEAFLESYEKERNNFPLFSQFFRQITHFVYKYFRTI